MAYFAKWKCIRFRINTDKDKKVSVTACHIDLMTEGGKTPRTDQKTQLTVEHCLRCLDYLLSGGFDILAMAQMWCHVELAKIVNGRA